MSKLIDKLRNRARARIQPIGFRPAEAARIPGLLLSVQVSSPEGVAAAAEARPDALLLTVENPGAVDLPGIVKAAGDVPLGCLLPGVATEEGIKRLQDAGCDFLVFEPANMPVKLLSTIHMGKALRVELSVANGLARAIDHLDVDAVLVSPPQGSSLSVGDLMAYHHMASLVAKPLFTFIASGVDAGELEALRDARIEGVFLSGASKEDVERVRHAIESLPPARRRPRRTEAVLPPVAAASARERPDEEEEEPE